MADYSKMTTEDFDQALLRVLEDETMEGILQVPGLYEIVADYYNQAALDHWAQANPEQAYPENEDDLTEADGELLKGCEYRIVDHDGHHRAASTNKAHLYALYSKKAWMVQVSRNHPWR